MSEILRPIAAGGAAVSTQGGSARRVLVLGGARSGKSRLAEQLTAEQAGTSGLSQIYIATAEAWDDEMRARLAEHRRRRGPEWRTVEAPTQLPAALAEASTPTTAVLVDCLTLWLTNVMLADQDTAAAGDALIAAVTAAPGPVILVSNEVGLGIVPDNALARRFRDAQGRLNQDMAAACDTVIFVAAGLPMTLKAPA